MEFDPPPALCLEDAAEAAREDLLEVARARLVAPAWRAGHREGFARGAAWAARLLGATLIHRPPSRERDTLDEAKAR